MYNKNQTLPITKQQPSSSLPFANTSSLHTSNSDRKYSPHLPPWKTFFSFFSFKASPTVIDNLSSCAMFVFIIFMIFGVVFPAFGGRNEFDPDTCECQCYDRVMDVGHVRTRYQAFYLNTEIWTLAAVGAFTFTVLLFKESFSLVIRAFLSGTIRWEVFGVILLFLPTIIYSFWVPIAYLMKRWFFPIPRQLYFSSTSTLQAYCLLKAISTQTNYSSLTTELSIIFFFAATNFIQLFLDQGILHLFYGQNLLRQVFRDFQFTIGNITLLVWSAKHLQVNKWKQTDWKRFAIGVSFLILVLTFIIRGFSPLESWFK